MKKLTAVAVCLLVAAGLYWVSQAGNLEPPGPPAPTMKPLNDVEPRIPIRTADLPRTISSPGSYYLAENITVSEGFNIASDNVTIDLNGFALSGGTASAVQALVPVKNITVRNGTVSNWNNHGIELGEATSVLVVGVTAEGNGNYGIAVGNDSTVLDSIATNNSNNYGIAVGDHGLVSNCVATANAHGIYGGDGVTITDSVAANNGGEGIRVVSSAVISRCSSFDNGNRGILAQYANAVTDCTFKENQGNGIEVYAGNYIARNLVDRSGSAAGGTEGAGIKVFSYGNRIEGNTLTGNDQGIDTDSGQNLIIKNSARGNGIGYDFSANNSHGPIVVVTDVGDISGTTGADHPWANFIF